MPVVEVRLRNNSGFVGDSLDNPTLITSGDTYIPIGGDDIDWSADLSPEDVNDSSFGVGVRLWRSAVLPESNFANFLIDHVRVTVLYTLPPDITVSPSVDYGPFTRLGPNNTPAIIEFEIEEAE